MRETESSRNLYEIAEPQYGFFTTKQAKEAGYDESKHAYHVRAGNWIREHRGIYRLRNFPSPERPDLVLWFLWSRDRNDVPQGVYSHDTALSLYEFSDINPAKLHMTVPKGFRRNSAIPKALILHKADLVPTDSQDVFGVRATTPLRTIADLIAAGKTDESILKQAITEGLARGLITRRQIERAKLPPAVRAQIDAFVEESANAKR
ncbi:MAG: type IV toxin-antitoxin system AbiEi family antitoxin domain-containing protein [Bryobacteraceae bacterium]